MGALDSGQALPCYPSSVPQCPSTGDRTTGYRAVVAVALRLGKYRGADPGTGLRGAAGAVRNERPKQCMQMPSY
jgi:hypothetical protein